MPFIYGVVPAVNFTTSATPNTEIDALFVKPGARTMAITHIQMQGKGAQLTSLSGIIQRLKRYFTTASAGGSAVTPAPRSQLAPAATSSAGQASAGVTPGTGGPTPQLIVGCSATGPGSWDSLNNNDVAPEIDGSATQSLDLFNSSGTASLVFETAVDIQE